MSDFMTYMLEAGISLSVFYLFYYLVLKNDTLFAINRIVLLFSVIGSMILPLIAPALTSMPAIQGIPHLSLNFTATQTQPSDAGQILNTVAENSSFEWETWKIIALIYFAGSFIVFA